MLIRGFMLWGGLRAGSAPGYPLLPPAGKACWSVPLLSLARAGCFMEPLGRASGMK